MAEFTVFYSWQSDLPKRITRDVIHEATLSAINRLQVDASVEDSPRLDHDTLDVAGAPEIARTIFEKIENAGVFIADLTFVGESKPVDVNKKAKRLPNANVLLELGYAAAHLGWDRIILVLNSHFGRSDELPFDLVHRRFPIKYRLTPNATNVDDPQQALSDEIEDAIKLSLGSTYSAATKAVERMDVACVLICRIYGSSDYFSVPPYRNLNERLARMEERDALARLLDLRLIQANYGEGASKYAYHWTYLGKQAIKVLGIPCSKPPNTEVEKMELPPPVITAAADGSGGEMFQYDVSATTEGKESVKSDVEPERAND